MFKEITVIQKGLLGTTLLLASFAANAGVYMGTGAGLPPGSSVPNPPPPVEAEPYTYAPLLVEEVTTDAPPGQSTLGGCEVYSGKGPLPANPCPVVAVTEEVVQVEQMMVEERQGSLKENVERIIRDAGWGTPVWKPSFDYNWVGNVTITANDIQGILTKLLEPYPLQAVFYEANHVVAIVPRRNV